MWGAQLYSFVTICGIDFFLHTQLYGLMVGSWFVLKIEINKELTGVDITTASG